MMMIQPGQILDGKYRIVRELGAGAMGAVYLGENVAIRRSVAIKLLLPHLAGNSNTVTRFEREAQAAGRIGSEHIVEVLDLGRTEDGSLFMVMELLEGQTLRDRIKSAGRLKPRAAAPIAQQLLSGLEAAHAAEIIHRDLKPENIFLVENQAGQRDFVKILDFGVSKFNPLNDEEGMSMTRTGAVVGTPFYMAPEQAKGSREIDARSDLYSVGVILYEAVTGHRPFIAGTFNELIFKIALETPPPPEQYVPDLDPAFCRLVRKAMARDPGERFQTAAEMGAALSYWLHTGQLGPDHGKTVAMTIPMPVISETAFQVPPASPSMPQEHIATSPYGTPMVSPSPPFAGSLGDTSARRRSGRSLVGLLVGGACILLGAGGFFAYRMMSTDASESGPVGAMAAPDPPATTERIEPTSDEATPTATAAPPDSAAADPSETAEVGPDENGAGPAHSSSDPAPPAPNPGNFPVPGSPPRPSSPKTVPSVVPAPTPSPGPRTSKSGRSWSEGL